MRRGVRSRRCRLAIEEQSELALGGSDGSQQAIVGAFVGETLPGTGAQREINSVGVNEGRHALARNPTCKSGFHFAQ